MEEWYSPRWKLNVALTNYAIQSGNWCNMRIEYDATEDILFIKFNNEAVQKDVSYGWNVHAGMTKHGIGQISILNAKKDHLLPIQLPKQIAKISAGKRTLSGSKKRVARKSKAA